MIRLPFRLQFLASLPILLLCTSAPPRAFAQQPTTPLPRVYAGTVLDAQDAAILRAHIRVIDERGLTVGRALTDDLGRFRVESASTSCRIEASLPGFRTSSAPCTPGEVRLVLAVAPVRESVVVSATRDAAPTSQVGSAVTVFTADDLARRGAPLVADVLRASPGVTVVRSGGLGNQTSLFVRGGESSYNKVLLDGIPLNEPGGTFDFGNLTTSHLDRIEVVRGAESALFGSDAMASVVQLFTRRGSTMARRAEATVHADAGSHDTLRGSAGVAGRAAAWDYAGEVARFRTDNHVPNNRFDGATVSWNAAGRLRPSTTLRTLGRIEDRTAGTPGATAFGRADMDARYESREVTAGLTLQHHAGPVRQQVSYAYATADQTSTNLVEDPPFVPRFEGRVGGFEFFDFPYHSHNVLRRHHLGYQANWRIGRGGVPGEHFLTAAFEWDGERARLEDRLNTVVVPASRDNVGWTLQHQLIASRTAVTSGLRVERNESFGTAVVPRVSAVHLLRRGGADLGETTITFTAGAGVKEPTILQSFSPTSFFLGNPDLEPERSRAISAGVTQRLAGGRARLDLVWFSHRYRQQISTRTISFTPFVAQYFNIGRTDARGLELGGTLAPTTRTRVRAGYTLLDSRIVESTSPFSAAFQEGNWAFRRPRHSGFLELGLTPGPVDVTVTGVFTGTRVDSDFGTFDPGIESLPAHQIWSAAARYRLRPGLDVTVRIENLSDARYMEPLGYPALGRTVHAGVRVRF